MLYSIKIKKVPQLLDLFFFRTTQGTDTYLYFFRISIGLFCLVHFLSTIKDFELLYTDNGLIPSEIGSLFKTTMMPSMLDYTRFTESAFGLSYGFSLALYKGLYLTACVLLCIGFTTRIAALSLLFLHLMLFQGSHLYMYGVDFFTSITLFYCLIFPVGRVKSVDNLLFGKKEIASMNYRRVFQMHLCFVYFFSGLDKIMGPNWRNGEAIWKAINLPAFTSDFHLDYGFMITFPIIPLLIGWATIVIELMYPVFIFGKKTRNIWLALTILMHVGIMITLNLYFFATLMIILNLTAFFDFESERKTAAAK